MTNSLSTLSAGLVEALVRPEIRAMHSYHVPDSSGMLKMDAMENPNLWPGEVQAEWLELLKSVDVNRYPDPSCAQVKQGIRDLLQLDRLEASSDLSLDLLLGNGSDEIIQILAMALATKDRGVLAVEPSFVMYKMISDFVGVPYHGVELNQDFSINLAATLSAINTHNPSLIFLAAPNNPTGNVFSEQALQSIIEAAQGLVVLDEAYMAFTDSDLLSYAARYPNVVVMRTFSKVGLAGLRLGFLVGSTEWLSEFEKLRLPYNINVLTQASVSLALKHYSKLEAQCELLKNARTTLLESLGAMPSLDVFPSEANFVLVRCNQGGARAVFEQMKANGVLIKCLDGAHPLLAECLRLTVGTPDENDRMLEALAAALAQS